MSLPQRSIARGQRGVALLMLMVILVLGTSWYLLSALNSSSANADLARRQLSSKALAEAKQALLGYAAAQAATDANPGRLPCPEAAGYATNADPDDDGKAAGVCTLPAVGRLPWRTLGLDKLTDGYGEPLWYVVSPAFAYPNTGAIPTFSLNSNTAAQLTVDGTSAAAVALIIAPGPAMNVQTASGCTARVQQRNFPTTFDLRDYLECENASTEVAPGPYNFATTGASTSFNDQVVKVTHEELFNIVEPVVAKRIETEIVPVLKGIYGSAQWSLTANNPIFPYAVPFVDPGTSTYLGVTGTYEGLLPFSSQSATMKWNTSSTPTLWTSNPSRIIGSPSCTIGSSNTRARCRCRDSQSPPCKYHSLGTATQFRITATTQQSVTTGLHNLDSTKVTLQYRPAGSSGSYTPSTASATASINSNGTATIIGEGTLTLLPGFYDFEIIMFSNTVVADHPLLSPSDSTTGWFVRNEWYRLLHYATTPNHTASGSAPRTCIATVDCLSVTNLEPTGRQRAILILAGRALGTQDRQNSPTEADYFEDPQNYNGDLVYVKPTISNTTNDRVIVLDANPVPPPP